MNHSELCPVCKGSGKTYTSQSPDSTSAYGYYTVCHGCGGIGWVTVEDHPNKRNWIRPETIVWD